MQDVMSGLVFWEGHVVQSVHEQADGSLLINLSEDPNKTASCGQCGLPCVLVHDRRWRRIRERDCFDRRVWLNVPVRRVDCHHCGARVTERIAWLAEHARITRRLWAWVEALAQILPIAHVPDLPACIGIPSRRSIDFACSPCTAGLKDAACAAW